MLQGHSEDFPEVTTDQLGKLGGPRPKTTGLEEDSEDRGSNLRSQPDRHHQGQKGDTKVTCTPDKHRLCPDPFNMPALTTNLPRANQPGRTSSDATQNQSDDSIFCKPSFGPPTVTPPSPVGGLEQRVK
ncbi:unnamed protein product [Schistocephalus solidus]|uniref:Uncharacterized protein n=1 Tax=Schistocephalus solidus TaxID=70667 RepID=A0A183S9Q7_SCHSO|nr:unnamed protein product [Schistocephalus solidus]